MIYKNDLIPEDYTLVDIAYHYNWRRDQPMQFFYRIFKKTKVLLKRRKRKMKTSETVNSGIEANTASREINLKIEFYRGWCCRMSKRFQRYKLIDCGEQKIWYERYKGRSGIRWGTAELSRSTYHWRTEEKRTTEERLSKELRIGWRYNTWRRRWVWWDQTKNGNTRAEHRLG